LATGETSEICLTGFRFIGREHTPEVSAAQT
jgi:hypothetical protein